MEPSNSRRAILQTTGLALVAGLAGCTLKHVPQNSGGGTTPDGGSDSGQAATGTDADGGQSADGSSGTDGQSTSDTDTPGGGGDAGTEGPSTVTPRTEYTFTVENRITPADLDPVSELEPDAPATITIDVEAHFDDREETLFERTIELAPEERRTFTDAFTTEPNGPSYVIRTKLETFAGEFRPDASNHSAGQRFTPGGFGAPTGDTFEILVMDLDDGERLQANIDLDVAPETSSG